MNLFVQSISNRSCELVYQAEGGGYFKHQVIKDHHAKIPKPIQPAELAHQVKLGNTWNEKLVKLANTWHTQGGELASTCHTWPAVTAELSLSKW